jgi:hypothetical protein
MCFNNTKNFFGKRKSTMFLFLCVFGWIGKISQKEVGEIISEMKKNMSSPMRIPQGLVDQISIK